MLRRGRGRGGNWVGAKARMKGLKQGGSVKKERSRQNYREGKMKNMYNWEGRNRRGGLEGFKARREGGKERKEGG